MGQDDGKHESLLVRALWTLPLLAVSTAAAMVMNVTISLPWGARIVDIGTVVEAGGIPIRKTFYGFEALDDFIAVANTFFFPTIYGFDPVSRRQTFSFLVDISSLIAVCFLESIRGANGMTVMQIPSLFLLLAQGLGGGLVIPVYFFLHYIFSRIPTPDGRQMAPNFARAIVPAVVLGHLTPLGLACFHPNLPFRQTALFAWQMYPIYISAALYLFSKLPFNTAASDKTHAPTSDLPYVRFTIGALAVASGLVWVVNWTTSPFALAAMFVPRSSPQSTDNMTAFAAAFLQWDEVFVFSAGFLWLAYLFGDMKRAGMDETGWARLVLSAGVGVLAFGPGAAFGLGWLWREEGLAKRKQKGH